MGLVQVRRIEGTNHKSILAMKANRAYSDPDGTGTTYQNKARFKAYSALGFKCDCGATKDLRILHKAGPREYAYFKNLMGYPRWLLMIASNSQVRANYYLICSSCYMRDKARENEHPKSLDSSSS